MSERLWSPNPERIERTAMTSFRRAYSEHIGVELKDFDALHAASVQDPAAFWRFYAQWAGISLNTEPVTIMSDDPMPYTRWFEGATLNYAQALLHPVGLEDASVTAIIAVDETGREERLSYADLRQQVARCAAALRRSGIEESDRVAAYISNVPQAVVLMLACASMGAIYSSCSPDFGFDAANARFGQIQPKVLVASEAYPYNGKRFSTLDTVRELKRTIEGLEHLVLIPFGEEREAEEMYWEEWLGAEAAELSFASLPFDHPLYILYSSGTTGLPKAMMHRAGGVLLMHHKEHRLHCDIKPGDRVLYFTTCGWMMWNWLVSVLAQGATIVLYEGSPSYPDLGVLWRLSERLGITFFGTSARFIHASKAEEVTPKNLADLSALQTVASTGSPLSPAGFSWVYDAVKDDVHLASVSGGTDIVGCFMLGDPTRPVYAGQIQGPGLGVDLAAFNEQGQPVVGEPGELVCRQPLPSMPLKFWNDPGDERYKGAYFNDYPGVWRHGDLIEFTPQGGIIVYGRSDATLNPGGVRIGTAEIYRPLEALEEIVEACAVGKREEGDEVIWLFVVLQPGVTLDDELTQRIRSQIRKGSSPRHVPKCVFSVSQLPRTRSGKASEIAVSRLVNGQDVTNREVMANPEALDEIADVINQ